MSKKRGEKEIEREMNKTPLHSILTDMFEPQNFRHCQALIWILNKANAAIGDKTLMATKETK